MRTTRKILATALLVLGVILVVVFGVWPLSVQFVAGVMLIVFGALRLRYF
jgi:hypothetical protein